MTINLPKDLEQFIAAIADRVLGFMRDAADEMDEADRGQSFRLAGAGPAEEGNRRRPGERDLWPAPAGAISGNEGQIRRCDRGTLGTRRSTNAVKQARSAAMSERHNRSCPTIQQYDSLVQVCKIAPLGYNSSEVPGESGLD